MEQETGCVQECLCRGGSLIVSVTCSDDQWLDGPDADVKRSKIFENTLLLLLDVITKNASLHQIETRIALLSDECVPTHAVGSPCLNPDSPPDVLMQMIAPIQDMRRKEFMISASVDPASTTEVGDRSSGFELIIRITRVVK